MSLDNTITTFYCQKHLYTESLKGRAFFSCPYCKIAYKDALIRELLEALKPFAQEASEWNIDGSEDSSPVHIAPHGEESEVAAFTTADLYKATKALESAKKMGY